MLASEKIITGLPVGNRLLIDYFSMTSRIHTVDDMVDLLGMRDVNWEEVRGNHGFAHRITFNGVHIHFNRNENEGMNTGNFVWLEMSGQGCRCYETYGTGDFEGLINLVNTEYGKKNAEKDVRLTRLDVAFDDMDGVFDIDRIFMDTYKKNFVTRFRDYEHIGGSRGFSVNFGSKASNVFIRIYDKAEERGYTKEEVPHWIRNEIQLKSESAQGFAWNLQFDGLQALYSSTLKNYLSFRVPSETDSNKRRWEEADYWSNFLQGAIGKSLLEKPGVEYNLSKCQQYVMSQPIGSIKTLIKIFGIDHFIRMVYEAPMPKNPKYLRLINEHRTQANTFEELNKILNRRAEDVEFLKELQAGYDEIHRTALQKARDYRKKEEERARMRYLSSLYQNKESK